jgi:hypothetical protein
VSLKRFLGWEPKTLVEHEYDNGVLVRSVHTVEVEWDEEQRAWMQALAELDQQSCAGCGGFLPHTTDITMSDGYVADHPLRCHRCEALAIRRKSLAGKNNPESFVVWPVRERGR